MDPSIYNILHHKTLISFKTDCKTIYIIISAFFSLGIYNEKIWRPLLEHLIYYQYVLFFVHFVSKEVAPVKWLDEIIWGGFVGAKGEAQFLGLTYKNHTNISLGKILWTFIRIIPFNLTLNCLHEFRTVFIVFTLFDECRTVCLSLSFVAQFIPAFFNVSLSARGTLICAKRRYHWRENWERMKFSLYSNWYRNFSQVSC